MSERWLEAWLRLSLVPGLRGATLRELLKRYGSPEEVLRAPRGELARLAGEAFCAGLDAATTAEASERALAWSRGPGCRIVALGDPAYPQRLLECHDPPSVLYCRGHIELLRAPALAVVGSRTATAQGLRDAEAFARALAEQGLTIVSGLALGIDSAAHRGGLAATGSTIAVLGCGVDRVYPRENEALAAQIAERGLLVSEFPLGTAPLARNFPRRNHTIAGLALGCLVVEAAPASGSLITARAAAEQGREVFAIPGSIHSPHAKGCHQLIKAGAKLVECADDVLAELPGFAARVGARARARAEPEPDSALLVHMGDAPTDVDTLCARSGMPPDRVTEELLRLELAGRIASLPGGRWQRLR